MHRVWSRALVATAAAIIGVIAMPVSPAHADDTLVKSSPQADSSLDVAPRQIAMTFSGTPQKDGSEVTVTGPDGKQATGGEATFQDTSVVVPFSPTAVGEYTVNWKIISSDGDPVDGSWKFTLTSTKKPVNAAATTGSGSSGSAVGGRQVTITPLTQLATTPWWIWVGVAAAVIIAAVAIIGNGTAQSAQLARRGRHEPRPGRFPNVDNYG